MQEVFGQGGDYDREPTEEDLRSCTYLDKVHPFFLCFQTKMLIQCSILLRTDAQAAIVVFSIPFFHVFLQVSMSWRNCDISSRQARA